MITIEDLTFLTPFWAWVYHFQMIIGSAIALGAGAFIYYAAKLRIEAEDKRIKESTETIATACRAEVYSNLKTISLLIDKWALATKPKSKESIEFPLIDISTFDNNIHELGKIVDIDKLAIAYDILAEFKSITNQISTLRLCAQLNDDDASERTIEAFRNIQNQCAETNTKYPFKDDNEHYF